MPNHVVNFITIKGDEQKKHEMLETIKADEFGIGTVDFNKIIPMPESLDIEAGGRTDNGLKAYQDFIKVYTLADTRNDLDLLNIPIESEKAFLEIRSDIKSDEWELGKQAFQNIQKYGSPTWYEWCINNWGTKWNSYGYEPNTDYSESETIYFQTAWSAPHPILEKLSEMYPTITFEHRWADEDLGSNCGSRTHLGGEIIDEFIPEGFRAMQFALDMWDCEPEVVGLTLNKTETAYILFDNDEYELIELFGKPALFTNDRLTDADIPNNLYCYHLRESDDGTQFSTIEPQVKVNHSGSVITDEPIDFGDAGYIEFTDDNYPNFLGNQITFRAYVEKDFEQGQAEGVQQL